MFDLHIEYPEKQIQKFKYLREKNYNKNFTK